MPPALAVGLLPFVMVAPNAWYLVSVALGTIALTVCAVGLYVRSHSPEGAQDRRGESQSITRMKAKTSLDE